MFDIMCVLCILFKCTSERYKMKAWKLLEWDSCRGILLHGVYKKKIQSSSENYVQITTIILVTKKKDPYTFYRCLSMWIQSQVIIQIQNSSFNLTFYLSYVLLKCSPCEKLIKSVHSCVISFCSFLFSILAVTLIKRRF